MHEKLPSRNALECDEIKVTWRVDPLTANNRFKSVLLDNQITIIGNKYVFKNQELQMLGLKLNK